MFFLTYSAKFCNSVAGVEADRSAATPEVLVSDLDVFADKRDGKWRALQVAVVGKNITAMTKPGYRAPIDRKSVV